MKKTTILIISIILGVYGQLMAQTSNVTKVGKSVFTLTTYKSDGSIQGTTHGVYFGNDGEGIAPLGVFLGASSAVIIDGSGKKADVVSITGANDVYDMCRFKLSSTFAPGLVPAQREIADNAWLVNYSTKKSTATKVSKKSAEKFLDKYNYYVFNEEVNEDNEGCPIVNDAGELVGLVQRSSTTYDIQSTDANYYFMLESSGLSAQDPTLMRIGIHPTLPTDHEQARLLLLMIGMRGDRAIAESCINDYIQKYPTDIDGYGAQARINLANFEFDKASNVLDNCIKKAANKDEAYSEYATLIYESLIHKPDSIETTWNMGMAEENIRKAIEVNSKAGYKHQLAQVLYNLGKFDEAFSLFEEISKTELMSSEVFYEMAQTKSNLGAEQQEILSYLDKAVEVAPQPLTPQSAPYILARGIMLDDMGEYRKALQDYNRYDTLMYLRASDDFYYTRYKCELKMRQFQQALNDIAHAAFIAPMNVTYLAEMAALQLRVGRYEDAVRTCELCKRATDEYADVYIVEGVALYQLGRKDESKASFMKAKELGDERADEYMQKYK